MQVKLTPENAKFLKAECGFQGNMFSVTKLVNQIVGLRYDKTPKKKSK